MKMKKPISISKGSEIVAVISVDGKVLTSNEDLKYLINFLIKVGVTYPDGLALKVKKPDNEFLMRKLLTEELTKEGYTVN